MAVWVTCWRLIDFLSHTVTPLQTITEMWNRWRCKLFCSSIPLKSGVSLDEILRDFLHFVIFTPFNGDACKAQFQKCAFILLQTAVEKKRSWRTPARLVRPAPLRRGLYLFYFSTSFFLLFLTLVRRRKRGRKRSEVKI